MTEFDVRDLRGRTRRLVVATLIGIVGSLAVTMSIPTRDHFPTRWGDCGFSHQAQGWLVEGGSPSLMIAGAIVMAVLAYGVLGWVASSRAARRGAHVAPLPRATATYASRACL